MKALMTVAAVAVVTCAVWAGDPELQAWILAPAGGEGGEFADLVVAVRKFHGL